VAKTGYSSSTVEMVSSLQFARSYEGFLIPRAAYGEIDRRGTAATYRDMPHSLRDEWPRFSPQRRETATFGSLTRRPPPAALRPQHWRRRPGRPMIGRRNEKANPDVHRPFPGLAPRSPLGADSAHDFRMPADSCWKPDDRIGSLRSLPWCGLP